jgi:hypothetical protein
VAGVVHRVFRAAVMVTVGAVVAVLFAGFVIDIAVNRGALEGSLGSLNDDWNPLTLVELVPAFWPALLFATGLALGLGLEAAAQARRAAKLAALGRARYAPVDIVFDPGDHRCIYREFPNGQLKPVTRFRVGIHNGTGNRTLQDVVVSAKRGTFVKRMLEPVWGGRTRHIARIEPNATEFVELLGRPEEAGAADGDDKVRRFVIRVRAKDAKETSAKFEFNAHATPMMRRVA